MTESVDRHFDLLFSKDLTLTGRDALSVDDFSQYEDHSGDSDVTFLENEFIDLSEVFLEQIQLSLPFRPLCQNDCRGVCQTCGANFNQGRCACHKLEPSTEFSPFQAAVRKIEK